MHSLWSPAFVLTTLKEKLSLQRVFFFCLFSLPYQALGRKYCCYDMALFSNFQLTSHHCTGFPEHKGACLFEDLGAMGQPTSVGGGRHFNCNFNCTSKNKYLARMMGCDGGTDVNSRIEVQERERTQSRVWLIQ